MIPKIENRIGIALSFVVPLVISVALTGCSIKKPQSPTWLTTWDIPVSNKTYDITQLLEKLDDSLFVFDSLGNPGFRVTEPIDTIGVDNNLTYDGVTVDLVDSIGTLAIAPPSDQNASINVNDLLPVSLGVVPATSFSYSKPLPPLDRFTWVDIQSGRLDLQFYNGLEVDLDSLSVTVIDMSDMHVIGTATCINGLNYLETETRTIDVSGQTISNTLSMDLEGHTPGGVLINAGPQNLDVTASFPDSLFVTAGRMETPDISISTTAGEALSDSTMVVSATVESGSVQVDVVNYSQLTFFVDISSMNFTIGGSPLQVSRTIYPGADQVILDLAGYRFTPDDSGSTQYVNVDFHADSPPSAPAQYTVSSSDSITMTATLSPVIFSSITGRISPTNLIIDPMQRNIDIPEGFDRARLTQAVMNLNLYNNSMVDADVNLIIDGGGNSIQVNDRIAAKGSPGAPPALTTITIGSQQLYDFLNPAPAQITISGDAILNPDYVVTTVSSTDNFYGDLELYSPLALAISDTISIDLDVSETGIDPDSRPDNFTETFKYGTFDAEFENHLPLGVSLTFYIGTSPDSTLFSDPAALVLGPYDLQAGITDSNGHVVQSSISSVSDSLDNSELSIFDNDTLYFGQQIDLLPTDPAGVQVLGVDYVNIRANARIQLQVGENLWSDNQ